VVVFGTCRPCPASSLEAWNRPCPSRSAPAAPSGRRVRAPSADSHYFDVKKQHDSTSQRRSLQRLRTELPDGCTSQRGTYIRVEALPVLTQLPRSKHASARSTPLPLLGARARADGGPLTGFPLPSLGWLARWRERMPDFRVVRQGTTNYSSRPGSKRSGSEQ
jgi:hypothetical protein